MSSEIRNGTIIFNNFLSKISHQKRDYEYHIADMVTFATLTEFIEAMPVGKDIRTDSNLQENLKRVCRIMFNMIEKYPD